MIPEHELGELLVDIPKYGLRASEIGTVVMVHDCGAAYMVEFFTPEGDTRAVVFVEGVQLRPVTETETKPEPAPTAR